MIDTMAGFASQPRNQRIVDPNIIVFMSGDDYLLRFRVSNDTGNLTEGMEIRGEMGVFFRLMEQGNSAAMVRVASYMMAAQPRLVVDLRRVVRDCGAGTLDYVQNDPNSA